MRGTRLGLAVGTALVATIVLATMGGGPVAAAHQFPDVPSTHVFHDEIDWLADNAVTEGFSDGTFRPAGTVTRQEMAAFLYRLWSVVVEDPPPTGPMVSFSDVPAGHPFEAEIEWLAGWEIAQGYPDGTYHPHELVTRQEMAAFLFRFWTVAGEPATGLYPDPGYSDVDDTHLFYDEISWMSAVGVAGGFTDGTFRPGASVDRGSMAAFMFRLGERTGPVTHVVNTAADGDDADAGDGVCEMTAGEDDCSLRAAISESNADEEADLVRIEDGVDPVLSIAGKNENSNATGDLDVLDHLRIEGNGATVDADGLDRVMQGHDVLETYLELEIHDLTIAGGVLSGEPGAGVYLDGNLHLAGVEVRGNDSSSPGLNSEAASGVYVTSDGGASSIRESVIAENIAPGASAALDSEGPSLTVEDTSIVDNTTTSGPAFGMRAFEGSMKLERVLLSGHSGPALSMGDVAPGDIFDSALVGNGSGIVTDFSYTDLHNTTVSNEGAAISAIVGSPSVTASTLVTAGSSPTVSITEEGTFGPKGSIIAGPTGTPRCVIVPGDGEIDSKGWNIGTDDSCGLDETSDLPSTDPLLETLGDNGGATFTHMIALLSLAVDAVPAGTAGLCDGSLPTDQRGFARLVGSGCDIGAVERQPTD